MPLKDWVTMIDLWPTVISIPWFQNKSAQPPPLNEMVTKNIPDIIWNMLPARKLTDGNI